MGRGKGESTTGIHETRRAAGFSFGVAAIKDIENTVTFVSQKKENSSPTRRWNDVAGRG